MNSVFNVINEMHDYLTNLAGVCDVKTNMQLPADRLSISEWEKKFNCSIPTDLANFYLVSNGLSVSWKVKCGETKFSVGKINLNSLSNLILVVGTSDSLEEKVSFTDLYKVENSGEKVPNLINQSCRLFHFEECDYDAHVFLVYFENKAGSMSRNPEMWLLDRSFMFFKVANSFSEYFRLMVMHFGLPQWQFLFTDYGPTPQARQFINMYASSRFDIKNEFSQIPSTCTPEVVSKFKSPNLEKIFKVVETKLVEKVTKTVSNKILNNNK